MTKTRRLSTNTPKSTRKNKTRTISSCRPLSRYPHVYDIDGQSVQQWGTVQEVSCLNFDYVPFWEMHPANGLLVRSTHWMYGKCSLVFSCLWRRFAPVSTGGAIQVIKVGAQSRLLYAKKRFRVEPRGPRWPRFPLDGWHITSWSSPGRPKRPGVSKKGSIFVLAFFFPSDMHLQKLGNVILDLYWCTAFAERRKELYFLNSWLRLLMGYKSLSHS